MTAVFLNGVVYSDRGDGPSLGEARVSAFDAGFQHAVGLFETMLGGVRRDAAGAEAVGWCYRLEAHMERLRVSAEALGLSDTLNPSALGEAVLQTIEHSGLTRARIRLTISAGDLNLLARGGMSGADARHDPTIMIVAQPATVYPAAMFQRGVSVVVADTRANPLNPFEGHKTLNYWWRLQALQAAASHGAGEALVLQVSNHLAGGCVSNVFLVKGGELSMPIARGEELMGDSGAGHGSGGGRAGLPSPVMPGVTRGAIREAAEGMGMKVTARMLSVQDVLESDEVFLTNSSWGVLPMVGVIGLGEKRAIGDGVPGAVAKRLREWWEADVARAELA